MKKRINPFRPGNGISPPYLAGRENEIQWFENSLDAALTLPQNLVLSGIRGTGKTVLLRHFENMCADQKWLCVRREFNSKFNQEDEFINAFLTDVITKTKGVSLAKKLKKPVIGFGNKKDEELEEDYISAIIEKYKGPLGDRLGSILKDVNTLILKAGFNGLVLLYDEFHFIEDNKVKNNFPLSLLLEIFSKIQQDGLRFYLVLSGLPPLFPNLVKAKTYAERMFGVKQLGNLTKADSLMAIKLPLRNSGIVFTDQLINKLIDETQGYPYFLQFYPYFLIQNIPARKIGIKEFRNMYGLLSNELDTSFFSARFGKASDAERDVLFAMTKLGPDIRVSEIRTKTKLSKMYLHQILLSLMEKGLIFKTGWGKYRFTLPLFEKYLSRKE